MTTTAELLADGFGRVREGVKAVLAGIPEEALTWRADPEANTVGWLVWHLLRIQDDHLAAAFGGRQVWTEEGWVERFGLPFDPVATGYGHSPAEVAEVRTGADLLLGYHEAVMSRTGELVSGIADPDLNRVVDERWDPPVTLGVRLVSVIEDDMQHVGQAALVRGLAERAAARR